MCAILMHSSYWKLAQIKAKVRVLPHWLYFLILMSQC
jgi:hypothetical protein